MLNCWSARELCYRSRMRLPTIALIALFAGCGDSTPSNNPDLSQNTADLAMAATPSLTVNNTLAWCTVTVNTGSGTPTTFSSANHVFQVASGTTVMLHAVPNPTFKPVVWTGVTTMTGADATYVVTGAATQMVTACCPLADGSGC
jgi:hypothetical protein